MEYTEKELNKQKEAEQSAKDEPQRTKWQNMFKELSALYGPPRLRRMALICHYTWCVTALSYYVTGNSKYCWCPTTSFNTFCMNFLALNADNLAANRVVYVASTGCVDLLSYVLSIVLLRFFGRKVSSCALFALAGFFLLSLLFVPRGMTQSFFGSITCP